MLLVSVGLSRHVPSVVAHRLSPLKSVMPLIEIASEDSSSVGGVVEVSTLVTPENWMHS
jgi:hypothetical protein